MTVTIDCRSAARLTAEGAICFDTDTGQAVCDGLPVPLPDGSGEITRPILICGSSALDNALLVARLQARGLPAWQVVDGLDHPLTACSCDDLAVMG